MSGLGLRRLAAFAILAGMAVPVRADAPLQDTSAFERAFATSLYVYDACGDALGGRMFRRALADKFAHCPFTPDARARYASRSRLQMDKARKAMAAAIEAQGGLPTRLADGAATCHAMQEDAEYRRVRAAMERFDRGEAAAGAVLPGPCDADSIAP